MNCPIPNQKEIRTRMGKPLADAFFELSNSTIKKFVGISPTLHGPSEKLWCSPSDQLIVKNSLKPPVPSELIQATAHKGILRLGGIVSKDYEMKLEKKIRKSLASEIEDIKLLVEAQQRNITKNSIKKIENECYRRLKFLAKAYDKKLDEALDNVIKKYNKILQKALVQTRLNVTHEMMKKMRNEVDFIVTDLNTDYERRYCIQKQNMIADFNEIIRNERMRLKEKLQKFQQLKIEELEVSKAKIINASLENSQKLLCCAQKQCDDRQLEIRDNYKKIILSLHESLIEANEKIEELKQKSPIIIPSNDKEIEIFWKTRICHILQQFQKFIQFILQSSPDQANFLLPDISLLRFSNENIHSAKL